MRQTSKARRENTVRTVGMAWRPVLAAAAAVPAVFGLMAPASAHDTAVWTSWGHGAVYQSHKLAYACDTRADGYSVYTKYVVSGYPYRYDTVKDSNGSKSGCGKEWEITRITTYRVCRSDPGPNSCSGWRST
jgi:hypothetical protein